MYSAARVASRWLRAAPKPPNIQVLNAYPRLKGLMEREEGRTKEPEVYYSTISGFLNAAKAGSEIKYLEKLALYLSISGSFDDVDFEKLGAVIPKVKKALGGDILNAFEKDERGLRDAIVAVGLARNMGRLVKAADSRTLALLESQQKKRAEALTLVSERSRGGTPNKSWMTSYNNGEAMQRVAEHYVTEIEPSLKKIKADLDSAFKSKDWKSFEDAYDKFLVPFKEMAVLWIVADKNRKQLILDRPLKEFLNQMRAQMYSIRDQALQTLKYSRMSPSQVQNAERARERMLLNWM